MRAVRIRDVHGGHVDLRPAEKVRVRTDRDGPWQDLQVLNARRGIVMLPDGMRVVGLDVVWPGSKHETMRPPARGRAGSPR